MARREPGSPSGGGIAAGLVGGLVFSLLFLVLSLAKGQDPWITTKLASVVFMGERALRPGFDAPAVLVGLLCHFGVASFWGLLFGTLFSGLTAPLTLLAGLLWGVVVWLGMYYVALPIFGLGHLARAVPVPLAVAEHMLFGLVIGAAFLPFRGPLKQPLGRAPAR